MSRLAGDREDILAYVEVAKRALYDAKIELVRLHNKRVLSDEEFTRIYRMIDTASGCVSRLERLLK